MTKSIIWTVLAVGAFAASMVVPYLEGKANDWWTIPPLFPADILPLLGMPISCVVLLGSWIRSFFPPAQPEPPVKPIPGKRYRVTKGLLFLVSALLLSGRFFLPGPAEFFHRGFTQYARTVLTPDEWRQIALYARDHPIPMKENSGAADSFSSESDDEALQAALRSATPFRKLPRYTRIWVSLDTVYIYWGGALVGHRNVLVMPNPSIEKSDAGFVAEDIMTSMEE